ncbi:MAG: hypothetical protein ACRDVD_07595 [Acidimicrobiia bacterium]
MAAANSPQGQELSKQSVESWVATVRASGTATADEIDTAAEMSLAQFAPDIVETDGDDEAG